MYNSTQAQPQVPSSVVASSPWCKLKKKPRPNNNTTNSTLDEEAGFIQQDSGELQVLAINIIARGHTTPNQ